MIHIADEVWSGWQSRRQQHEEPELEMLFVPAGRHDSVGDAVGAAIRDTQRQYEEDASGADRPFVGEWSWLAVSRGVLVQVVECDDLEQVLPAIGTALDRRGVAGAFTLWDGTRAPELPLVGDFIECRIRVRGERERVEPHMYFWHADDQACRAVLAAGERWCRELGPAAFYALQTSTLGPVGIGAAEPVVDRMSAALREHSHAELSGMSGDDYRAVAARPAAGGLSLLVGVGAPGHAALVAGLVGVLREQADSLAYAFVRRGWDLRAGLVTDGLGGDWPRRLDDAPRARGFAPQSFEDVFAPDAFAVQLLGPGYAGRIPDHPDWRAERVGTASVLLEHVDPSAWFAEPFVPAGSRVDPGTASVPDVLARGRAALAPILYRPGVLHAEGVAEEADL